MAKLSDVSLDNGSAFSVSLPAQSVTTFVGALPEEEQPPPEPPEPPTSVFNDKNTVRGNITLVTIRGKTLNVNAASDSKVRVKLVNMMGKTVAKFNASGNAKLSLKQIPAGAYIVEVRRNNNDGYRMTSAVILR